MTIDIVTTALAASASEVAMKAIKSFLDARRAQETQRTVITVEGRQVYVSPREAEVLESLRESLDRAGEVPSGPITLSRKGVFETTSEVKASTIESAVQREIAATALAISPDAVFHDARRRIDLVFRFNFGLAVILAIILLSGIAGAVASAFFLKSGLWATVFGGVAAADILGIYVWKPVQAINSALVATQRLEGIYLRVSEQIQSCKSHQDLSIRITCQESVWDVMQRELALLHNI